MASKIAYLAAAAVFLATFSPAAAQFGTVIAAAELDGANNIPANPTSPSTGNYTMMLTDTGGTFTLAVSDIANLTQVHLHNGTPTTADGPIILVVIPVLPFAITIDGTVTTSGGFNSSALVGPLAGKQMVDLANLVLNGSCYINAHTGSGDGTTFIRGQLGLTNVGQNTAPTPAPPAASND